MYVRFICDFAVEGSDAKAGFFCAAYHLRERDDLDVHGRERLEALLKWFRENLTIPQKFSRAKNSRVQKETARDLSWFKPTATECLDKSWEMIALLEEWGYQITMQKSENIGYLIFEDEHQVVADPFEDTPR